MTLQNYVQQFTNLRQNKSKLFGDAPHKPVLLLSIIELMAVAQVQLGIKIRRLLGQFLS